MENNLQKLLEKYRNSEKVKNILNIIAHSERENEAAIPRLQLLGMIGAQEAFIFTGVYTAAPRHHLIVALDKEEAAYLQNDIANLMPQKTVHFFPDSFKRPMYFEELNATNVLQRTETINKITSAQALGEIIVTYPEALFEKVVSPEALSETRIEIAIKANLDTDFLIEVLVEYGFERSDFVYEPGQFSIRGGIIDIFSYGNEYPYRIELFDTEVESIRTFDPASQLSLQNIAKVSIVPNINTKFKQNQKTSIFKILPEDTVIWIKDFQVLIDKLQLCFERATDFARTVTALENENLTEIFKDRAFIYPNDVTDDIKDHALIFTSNAPQPFKIESKITFATKPQPSFNKNFKLLIENLHENTNSTLENYLFTDNGKQIERFYSIFEDLDAEVSFHPVNKAIHHGFVDYDVAVACYTDHQIFERFHRYRLRAGYSKDLAINMRVIRELQPGDFVTHIDHGVGKFSGLEKININGHLQEAVRIIYKNNDILYVSINSLHKIAKYVGKEGTEPSLNRLGSDAWKSLKAKTKKQIKDIAEELIKLYAQRRSTKGYAFPPDGYLQNELEASFIYEDTPDQEKASIETKADMEKEYPMDRLVCGDVGFGKTEIAIRAAFKAVTDHKQVAILVPTTILALQHYKTFNERLKDFGVNVNFVNRFKSNLQKKAIFEKLKEGKIDIIIGTHAILGKDVAFRDLGLLIIDEEQKFGVSAKEKLRRFAVNVDTLTLTATPIPRTLQFSLMAARDLSIIRTPPPNRQPIHTEVRVFSEEVIKDAIEYETNRGGQVFFVHNRVQSLPEVAGLVQRLCPNINVAIAHGQLDADKLELTLLEFIEKKHDVLVCTNIIETGLDIANANTIIINNAHQFGLSDLHQLRGRVGRSNRKAFCYLFCPPLSVLTSDARKRLKTLEEYSDLGSGFDIAMRDLDIRGAGNMLGAEQSGFISEIGYETYQKILDEAIQELKENEFKEVFKDEPSQKNRKYIRDVDIETDVEMLLPTDYIENTQERLSLYNQIDRLENENEIDEFKSILTDRFGKLPIAVKEVFEGLRLRWICKELGFERLSLKTNKLRCYFVLNAQSKYYETPLFKNILKYVATNSKSGFSLKQSPKSLILIKDNVKSLKEARKLLVEIEVQCKNEH